MNNRVVRCRPTSIDMFLRAAPSHTPQAAWFSCWLPRRIGLQLALLISLCMVLSIMGYGVYRAKTDVAQARHSISAQMVGLAKTVAVLSNYLLQGKVSENIEEALLQLATVDGIYSVLVTDLTGKPITEVINKNLVWSTRYSLARVEVPDPSQPDSVLTTQAHNPVRHDFLAGSGGTMTAWQRIGGGSPVGWVRVNYRLDTFDAIAKAIHVQAAAAVTLATLVTLLVLFLLLRPILRALREATEFASHMDTNMGEQLTVSHRSSEIEALGNALNVVSEHLQLQHAELHSQKFALDQHAIVSITDLDDNITYANQRFCDISGYSAEELIGKNHRIVKSDEHPAALFEDLWHTITQCQVWHGEVKNRKKDGTFYWSNSTIVPLVGRDGLPHHYIGIRTDITSNKLLEEKLRMAKDDAEAATRVKAEFLANMSHEIRTPMNAVLGMLKLLQNTELNKRQLDYALKAESAAQSLLGLINDILDFSKIDAGKMTLEAQTFRLDKLMRDLSVIVSTNLGAKPVEVLFDIDPGTPKTLLGDAMRLQQVMINLASNAIKFTPQGEVVISITQLARTASHATLRFAVRDTGIGIAPENLQHIFTGFSQAEASTTRRFGGTGLGLTISRKLVALMGGELSVQSAVGQGSTFAFTITLPVALDASAATGGAKAGAQVAPDLHVLVVDDNPSAREVLGSMAASLGWQVDTAADGATALALVQSRAKAGQASYQAMFIDWQMPGMDGWQTIEQLQALHDPVQAPIVVMVTAHGREMLSQRDADDQARLHGFLVKPITASMLFDAVADAMGSRSQPSAQPAPEVKPKPLHGLRLLVVEDNLINQQVAQEILSAEGAQVELADNGQLGVDAVKQAMAAGTPFDAVLMDVQMPVMDGYSATRVLRQDMGLSQLPIIAMTANAMASDRDACLAAGMNEHVGKPFNLVKLVTLLQTLTKTSTTAPDTANKASTLSKSAAVADTQNILTQVAPAYTTPSTAPALSRVTQELPATDRHLLSALLALLKASDMQALAVFEQLQQSDTLAHSVDFERLAEAMAAFDFAAATKVCAQMTHTEA